MATEEILIPDIGNFDSVDVIDILMNIGDSITNDDPLLTVESDKASMDIPAPFSGTIKDIKVKIGDKVKEGSLVCNNSKGWYCGLYGELYRSAVQKD